MKLRIMMLGFLTTMLGSGAIAQEAKTPYVDGLVHEGVFSCNGSTCHSRPSPTGTTVRQDEFVIWQDQSSITGAHSRAYKVLLNQKSRTIARNLGIGPAHEAEECLACHADFVPEAQRGERFDITEGVGCEACHGGAENWLTSHYAPGRTHAQNIADGLYPTEDPAARAQLCLSCHLGSDKPNQFITHRIMGAGHPRISFELDLFTSLQEHHDEDADYRERKAYSNGAKVWAVGQAIALENQLKLFADPDLGRNGAFPELVFFDCHACHVTFSNDPDYRPTWRPNPNRQLGPGVPVFNDSNMIMLRAAVKVVAPDMDRELRQAGLRFHRTVSETGGNYAAATENLAAIAAKLSATMSEAEFGRSEMLQIIDNIVNESLSSTYTEYAAAEQAVIAIGTFLDALETEQMLGSEVVDDIMPALDDAYEAVDDPNRYDFARMRNAIRRVQSQLQQL